MAGSTFRADGSAQFEIATIRGPQPGNELLPHQVRVLEELTELEGRNDKLRAFLASEQAARVDEPELALMRVQERVMRDLANILRARLALWGVKP